MPTHARPTTGGTPGPIDLAVTIGLRTQTAGACTRGNGRRLEPNNVPPHTPQQLPPRLHRPCFSRNADIRIASYPLPIDGKGTKRKLSRKEQRKKARTQKKQKKAPAKPTRPTVVFLAWA